jgi:hydroxymethylbilane synthase
MKDVPTALPKGLVVGAVLTRANPYDILVHKGLSFLEGQGIVGTGSLRRRAQWLARYPKHQTENLRGNVNTRLNTLEKSNWNGAIFAAAGLERLGLIPDSFITLSWMLPAPAQGAMVVVVREEDQSTLKIVQTLNDPETSACVAMERAFLRELEGGCTAPIGALAKREGENYRFRGALFALDGSKSVVIDKVYSGTNPEAFGIACAREILNAEGAIILKEIRKALGQ